ncbi:alpha-ketoglutarate-dependent dioxygenase alkB [Striga asiatica]|uniref:Alpha-ketoglutarate-dependent dioxygenase alkB n=1 Tax=Striga asiatica TaxID=4170 RepID=A0A5A7RGP7_STRAF|nr:alpha-ketoglutarate-dependent dioxygenase alkB [Striga asiatica]
MMYRSDVITEETERTAFRKAEKKYKIYYDNTKKKKIPRPVELSEVVDFRSILENRNGELPDGVSKLNCDFDRPIFCLESRPGYGGCSITKGFYFIPAALSVEEQCQWIRESLSSFPQPPNRTNHNAIYGPIENLFASAKEAKFLVLEDKIRDDCCLYSDVTQADVGQPQWKFVEQQLSETHGKDACKSVSASVLLRKLRWSTLGLQFDWSKPLGFLVKMNVFVLLQRSYNVSLPHMDIPYALCQLAKKMAGPAMPYGVEFHPEAAIVNYFGLGDMLGGHLDDMEKDWSKPIVSMSLGCKAIFLLGGKSRDDKPIAMFLRSGDVVLMAGEARECFHGVPRIFTDAENAEISNLESQFAAEDDQHYLKYIRTSRININIRQVF